LQPEKSETVNYFIFLAESGVWKGFWVVAPLNNNSVASFVKVILNLWLDSIWQLTFWEVYEVQGVGPT